MGEALASDGLYIGIDVGTSGCRAVAIDGAREEVAEARVALPPPVRLPDGGVEQDPELWWEALVAALEQLLARTPCAQVRAIAVDGTSGTVFVSDAKGHVLGPALLYNDNRAVKEAERLRTLAPRESAAHGTTSGLAKLMWLLPRRPGAARMHTPADWFNTRLCGRIGIADANNVIKLGWDAVGHQWPAWLDQCVPRAMLPEVVAPGMALGPILPMMARRFGLPASTQIVAGTTDSTAAIYATGACEVGDAITSLGSTLVMKVIAEQPLFAPEYGLYSQPYGDRWLVGGGSNSGGAVLRRFFSDDDLARLTARIDPARPTGFDYYPLAATGERFPVCDPELAPRLTPRPADDALFLQGMLEGMARIERESYRLLQSLGAPRPARVISVGGGARNEAWSALRAAMLGVSVVRAVHEEAAYGSALLAFKGISQGAHLPAPSPSGRGLGC